MERGRTISARGSVLRRVPVFLTLLVMLLPVWLGPALGPVAEALGGSPHMCACGMARGTCGCPECAMLEHQRLRERAPRSYPVVKSTCDDHGAKVPSAAVPPMVLPGTLAMRESALVGEPSSPLLPAWRSRVDDGPPSPPPRSLSV